MSVLQKIGIAGFRSYSPDQMQFVEFFKPLTLICGENGSGKTTIIECLRLITAGKAPPNTNSGKTFVMDPVLTGRNESIGTVKLQFIGIKNRRFVASKTVQLAKITKKNSTKVQYKSLEQSIKTKDPITQQTISINQHCADIQKQIPTLFGVTPAVLDYVIFCHQEESLWPFSSSQALKNLFDELFNTTMFTASYDAMKEETKRLNKEIKELQIRLTGLETLRFRDINDNKEKLLKMYNAAKLSEKLPYLKQKLRQLQEGDESQQALRNKLMTLIGQQAVLAKHRQDVMMQLSKVTPFPELNCITKLEEIRGYGQRLLDNMDRISQKLTQAEQKLQLSKQEYINERAKESKHTISLIDLEIRKIKEALPQLKLDETQNSCIKIVRRLQDELKRLQTAQRNMENLKLSVRQIKQVELLPEQEESYVNEINHEFLLCRTKIAELQQKLKIMFMALYQPINQQAKGKSMVDPRQRISEVQVLLKDRRKMLGLFTKTSSPNKQAIQGQKQQSKAQLIKQKEKIEYVGIQLQQKMIEYCISQKKCHFCERQISDSEMRGIQSAFQQRKKKALGMIERLEKQIDQAPEEEPDSHRASISHIEKDIALLEQQLNELHEKQGQYQHYQQYNSQTSINSELDNRTRGSTIVFDRNGDPSLSRYNIKEKQQGLQVFISVIREYEGLNAELKKKERELGNINKVKQQNFRRQTQLRRNTNLKQDIERQIDALQLSISTKPLVRTCLQNLKGVEAINSSKQLVSLGYTGQIPPLTPKSGPKVVSLYNKFVSARDEYTILKKESDDTQAKLTNLNLRVQLMETEGRIGQIQIHSRTCKDKMDARRREYNSAMEQHTKLSTIVNDPEITRKIKGNPQDKEYWATLCELESKKLVLNELNGAMIALDRALHGFHRDKMEQINRLLKDTWQEIYHGRDIKYIQIKTNQEENTKKKTYSYCVTMVLQDNSEIEMRGRCSMGQKVLASVVIRLVLAQFFEGRCSILALDEPTTNLDTEHINMLGQQLARLVASRRGRDSFQLIVISHDHLFIKQLSEFATQYYEVRRNGKFSEIEAKDIERLS